MRMIQRIAFAACGAAILIWASPVSTASARANSAATSNTVACSVLEMHLVTQPAVTVVVFHQRDKADQKRLGDLLRRRPDSSSNFKPRTAPGTAQPWCV